MEPNKIITNIEPYSTEWLELRHGCFTASEIHKLMSDPRSKEAKEAGELSDTALTYILEKVHEKITGKVKMGIDNFATQWGIEHEPLAATWYGKLTGHTLSEPFLCFHETIDGFSCTPDRFVSGDGLAEIKCPANGANHLKHCFITKNEYFKKEHKEYYWQIIAQLSITKKLWCDLVSFDPRINNAFGMFIYTVQDVASDIELLEAKVKKARAVYSGYLDTFLSAK